MLVRNCEESTDLSISKEVQMVKLYVDPVITRIYGIDEHDFLILGEMLMFRPAGYFFTTAYQEKRWDGCVRLLHKDYDGTMWTYTGLMGRILKYLKKEQIEYEIIKSYNLSNIEVADVTLHGIQLRDYQQDIINICKAKKRGIIQSPTGSGKCCAGDTVITVEYDDNEIDLHTIDCAKSKFRRS